MAALTMVTAGAVSTAGPAHLEAQTHFPPDEDLELMLRYLVEDGETPGIVLGIIEADGSMRVLHYGSAGPDTRPLGPRSLFEIGSITKTFTGILLGDAVARGEVALEDPVSKHLPEGVTVPSWGDRRITLLDLATHRSGLPRMPDNFEPADPGNPYADYTAGDIYEFLSSHELRRAPGEEAEYSNFGMGLLGHVLERVSGMGYEGLVRERILAPLGMEMTGITLAGEPAEWLTKGHDQTGAVVSYWDVMTLAGAGGLRSNVLEMLAYVRANIDPPDSPLGQAIRLAHAPRSRFGERSAIGLGWQIAELGDRRLWHHSGGTAGFSASIGLDPNLAVGYVRLANAGRFGDDIAADFLRRGPPLDIPEMGVGPEVLRRYVGSYEMAPGQNMVVRMEPEGWLTMQAPGNVRFRMYAASDTSFFLKRTPWQFWFTRDGTGEVTGVLADLEGNERRGRKVSDDGPPPAVVAGNAPPEPRGASLAIEEMAPYVGTYVVDLGSRTLELEVYIEDGRLMAHPEGQGVSPLLHQGEHAFVPHAEPAMRFVFDVEAGRAERVTMHIQGTTLTGRRKR